MRHFTIYTTLFFVSSALWGNGISAGEVFGDQVFLQMSAGNGAALDIKINGFPVHISGTIPGDMESFRQSKFINISTLLDNQSAKISWAYTGGETKSGASFAVVRRAMQAEVSAAPDLDDAIWSKCFGIDKKTLIMCSKKNAIDGKLKLLLGSIQVDCDNIFVDNGSIQMGFSPLNYKGRLDTILIWSVDEVKNITVHLFDALGDLIGKSDYALAKNGEYSSIAPLIFDRDRVTQIKVSLPEPIKEVSYVEFHLTRLDDSESTGEATIQSLMPKSFTPSWSKADLLTELSENDRQSIVGIIISLKTTIRDRDFAGLSTLFSCKNADAAAAAGSMPQAVDDQMVAFFTSILPVAQPTPDIHVPNDFSLLDISLINDRVWRVRHANEKLVWFDINGFEKPHRFTIDEIYVSHIGDQWKIIK